MTKRVAITKAEIDRIMWAARREGCDAEIRKPDGTVITFKLRETAFCTPNDVDERASTNSNWEDVAA